MYRHTLLTLFSALLISGCGGSGSSGSGSFAVGSSTTTATTTTTTTPVAVTGAPYVLYTDIVSGPTSGGENNQGAYLSIFGQNFGGVGLGTTTKVYIGGSEVASYRTLGTAKVSNLQQITVQVGSLGGAAQGTALPIKVVVGGVDSNTNVMFMPNPGRMLFVDNVAGNDATAVAGDIVHPYRYVQGSGTALYTKGAWAVAQAGDMIVLRGHGNTNPWVDVGFENYFMRYRNKSGSAPTGASGTGAIVLMGYPGEDAYIHGTVAGGMTGGCVSAINGQSFPGMGQWAVVSNLRMDCEGYDGPISQEIYGDNWRVINNELSASTAQRSGTGVVPKMAGITGNGLNAIWYGNHIHDIQGSSQECHGIYIDGDGSYDIAYNQIHDIRDGNGFQVYVNGGNGSTEANNIRLHHNLIHDVSKHGLNIADGMHSGLKIWNNIVYNVANAGLRFNTNTISDSMIYNNTFYNTNTSGSYGALMNDWSFPAGVLDLQNNIFYVKSGVPYTWWNNGITGAGTITRNLWFNGSGGTGFDSAPVTLDPLFVTNGSDFHLQATSPAIAVGSHTAAVTSLVVNDYDLKARSTTSMDIGALKH
ncbi:MAG: hypothetical protein ACXWJK_00125 [Burkholderiaceae bacterium]